MRRSLPYKETIRVWSGAVGFWPSQGRAKLGWDFLICLMLWRARVGVGSLWRGAVGLGMELLCHKVWCGKERSGSVRSGLVWCARDIYFVMW